MVAQANILILRVKNDILSSMKANRIMLIVQAIGMYLMHIPLYVFFIVEFFPGLHEDLVIGLIKAASILMAVVIPICIANVVLSVISIFKGDADISKTVMKVKLALIPWYALNFAMCFIIVALMLNPFTMVGIPVVVALLLVGTYLCMAITSLPDLAYYLRRVFIKREEPIASNRVFTVVCLFIFCLDVIAGIVFHRQNKKAQLAAASPTTAENE